ncbi:MAG TPA: carbohydrate binding domain-containing protein, partial [Armatimonadota bacterium]|nr:carbohydrate binding domain-containing protein [Armatimonadota bacterium]
MKGHFAMWYTYLPFQRMFIGICLLFALFCSTAWGAIFQADGSIISPSTRIELRNGEINITNSVGDRYRINLGLGEKNRNIYVWRDMTQTSTKVDAATKSVVFTGQFTTESHPAPIVVEYRLSLTAEGKAHVEVHYTADKPITQLLYANLAVSCPRAQMVGHKIQADDDSYLCSETTTPNNDPSFFNTYRNTKQYKTVTFCADVPARQLTFRPQQTDPLDFFNDNPNQITMAFVPRDNSVSFDLDIDAGTSLSNAAETYAGVDFWSSDKLHMPQYRLCRNLLQNPGFVEFGQVLMTGRIEINFRSHTDPLPKREPTIDVFIFGRITNSRNGEFYSLDTHEAHSGRRSMKILGESGENPAHFSSFGIPIESGGTYTLSFYAKGDRPGVTLNLWNVTAAWGVFPGGKSFQLTTEWKRYSSTFTVANSPLTVSFGMSNPRESCAAWVDDVQVEQGTMTDYIEKPASCSLVTDKRNNLFQPGEKVNAKLEIHAPAQMTGNVKITVTGFNGKRIRQETRAFTANANGSAVLPLAWTEGLAGGLYLIETDISLANGFADRDFQRLVVMPALSGTQQHRRLFCLLGSAGNENIDRRLAFWQWIGVGSEINFDPPSHEYLAKLDKSGILQYSAIFDAGNNSKGLDVLKAGPAFTQEQLQTIEENAYQKARAYPEIRYWKTINEPDTNLYADAAMMNGRMLPALAAARRGILRANPQAKIMSPDPSNMSPSGGIQFIDNFLAAGGAKVCDIIAIHPYRERPESPDLDTDTTTLLKVLKKYNFTGDVWFTEGIYHQNYIIPAYSLDSHKGCSSDHNRTGDLSYDLGWGERECAAYTMRSWLVGLKYSDRVKVYVDWGGARNYMGVDMVPTASAFSVNTLERLLGNATYRQDIALGDNLRCYVFEDGQKHPVVAFWSCAKEVDTGLREAPTVDFSSLPRSVEVFDMVGTRQLVGENNDWRVTPCPMFLRGTPGSLKTLVAQLSQVKIDEGNANPLVTVAKMISATQVEIGVRNILSQPVQGQLQVALNSKLLVTPQNVAVKSRGTWNTIATLPLSTDTLRDNTITVTFNVTGKEKTYTMPIALAVLPCHHVAKAPTIDGDLSDWPTGTAIKLPN